jgi:hypothetical protein
VIVAVVAVAVVQPAIDQVINVIAVRHLLVTALVMIAGAGDRGTRGRIGRVHLDLALVVMLAVFVVQVPVVQKIDVAVVLNPGMPAMFAVDVLVTGVFLTTHFRLLCESIGMQRYILYSSSVIASVDLEKTWYDYVSRVVSPGRTAYHLV